MTNDSWHEMREAWRRVPNADVAAMVARARRARLRSAFGRTAVGVVALGLLIGAVSHSVSATEAVIALAMGVTVGATWVATIVADRRQRELLGEAGDQYLRARVELLRREINVFRFVWVIVALELLFLLPWWIEGIPIHFGSLASAAAVFTLWLPLAGVATLLAWTVRRWRRSRRELGALVSHSDAGSWS